VSASRTVAVTLIVLGSACADVPLARVESVAGDVRFEVFVDEARTAQERVRGLRDRTLEPDEGLLIAFPVVGEVCILNAGVDLDIDAIYAGADGRIVAVERGVLAGDAMARCHGDTARVLEIRSGVAAEVVPSDVLVLR